MSVLRSVLLCIPKPSFIPLQEKFSRMLFPLLLSQKVNLGYHRQRQDLTTCSPINFRNDCNGKNKDRNYISPGFLSGKNENKEFASQDDCIDNVEDQGYTLHNDPCLTEKICNHVREHSEEPISLEEVKLICDLFIDHVTDEKILEHALCTVPIPNILTKSASYVRSLLPVFANHHVPFKTVLTILTAYDEPIEFEPSFIDNKLQKFKTTQVDDFATLYHYLEVCPYIMFIPNNLHLEKKLLQLSNLFPPTELRHLLNNCPKLLLEPWELIEQKIYYIFEEMGLDQPHICFCKALYHPINHIINRHELLRRLGKYQMPKLHKDRLSYLQNTKLEYILDSSDRLFCKLVADISLEEYEVFEALAQEERHEGEDGLPLEYSCDAEEEKEKYIDRRMSYHIGSPEFLRERPKIWQISGKRYLFDKMFQKKFGKDDVE